MYTLIFDTETTGLPKNFRSGFTDTDCWPRIVQVSWQFYATIGNDTKLLDSQTHLVKPNGFEISDESFRIHGISTEKAANEGIELQDMLQRFYGMVVHKPTLVAHNLDFDLPVLACEFVRSQYDPAMLLALPRTCTMKSTVGFCKIAGRGRYKWPRLMELHTKLFGTEFEKAHDAGADVEATARCYFELRRQGVL